jgi:hypothetical protein
MPKGYFPSSFIHEAPGEAVSSLHWRREAGNRSFAQLLPQAHISPNNFENSFSFTREATSLEKLLQEPFLEKLKLYQTGPQSLGDVYKGRIACVYS